MFFLLLLAAFPIAAAVYWTKNFKPCKKCGYKYSNDRTDFCPKCGHRQKDSVFSLEDFKD